MRGEPGTGDYDHHHQYRQFIHDDHFHRHHYFVCQSSERRPRNSRTMINVDVKKNYKKVEEENNFREKLLAMKRYSGFLKRPEILETVYR